MKTYIYVALIVSALLNNSCKKSEVNNPPKSYTFNKEGLEYIQIPVNKYFVYKDSATGLLDSVVVTESKLIDTLLQGGCLGCISGPYREERFTLVFTKMNGASPSVWYNGRAIASFPWLIDSYTGRVAFKFPVCDDCSFLPTMTVESRVYNQVILVRDVSPGADNTCYWAKGVGMIQCRFIRGSNIQTFTLLRNG